MIPPHNPEAEEAVCGSLLIGGSLNAASGLSPQDFFTDQHRSIYEACAQLSERGVSINQITVAQKLAEAGKLEKAGGAAYLSHLISICPTSLDLSHYAEIVKRLATYRQMIDVGSKITQIGFKSDADLTKSISEADNLLLSLCKQAHSSEVITPEARALMSMERYEKLFKNERGIQVRTGLGKLDEALDGGFFPGDLTIIGARTGTGKTTLMRYLARNMCRTQNVFFASLEMPKEGITDMEIAAILGVGVGTIRNGAYGESLFNEIICTGIANISEQKVFLADFRGKGAATTDDILRTAEAVQTRYGLNIIFVDYLGRLTDRDGENQNIRLGNIANRLKTIALSLNVPVLVAVQLNRGVEHRDDKRPTMTDIRESGQIEEAADNIILIYRDKEVEDGVVELLIPKKRYGGNTAEDVVVELKYNWKHQNYYSVKPEGEQGEFDG